MNSPMHPDPSSQFSASEYEMTQTVGYAPSVPISVYRELAAELKATKARVDALNQQNQQLDQHNQLLRQEILRFAQATDQLRQMVEVAQPTPLMVALESEMADFAPPPPDRLATPLEEATLGAPPQNARGAIAQTMLAPVPKRPLAPSANPNRPLFTEQRPEPESQVTLASRTQDLSGLWLATTILVIVVSAFGAGFLIMKPLLSGDQ